MYSRLRRYYGRRQNRTDYRKHSGPFFSFFFFENLCHRRSFPLQHQNEISSSLFKVVEHQGPTHVFHVFQCRRFPMVIRELTSSPNKRRIHRQQDQFDCPFVSSTELRTFILIAAVLFVVVG